MSYTPTMADMFQSPTAKLSEPPSEHVVDELLWVIRNHMVSQLSAHDLQRAYELPYEWIGGNLLPEPTKEQRRNLRPQLEPLLDRVLRPILEDRLEIQPEGGSTNPHRANSPANKSDQVIAAVGGICVVLGANPPYPAMLRDLRQTLNRYLAGE